MRMTRITLVFADSPQYLLDFYDIVKSTDFRYLISSLGAKKNYLFKKIEQAVFKNYFSLYLVPIRTQINFYFTLIRNRKVIVLHLLP